jgi:hypothetical protein
MVFAVQKKLSAGFERRFKLITQSRQKIKYVCLSGPLNFQI